MTPGSSERTSRHNDPPGIDEALEMMGEVSNKILAHIEADERDRAVVHSLIAEVHTHTAQIKALDRMILALYGIFCTVTLALAGAILHVATNTK